MTLRSLPHHQRLGRSGLVTSRLWLGGMSFGNPGGRPWVLDDAGAARLVSRAIELGINTIDTCDVYSSGRSEEAIGRAIGRRGQRDRLVLCTKFGWPMSPDADVNARGYSRKHIIRACEDSLRRLGTDYIDLYQTHIWDPSTAIDEMVDALDRLVASGKVLYAGATDMPSYHLAKSVYSARFRNRAEFVSMQFHYNAVWREAERELIPFCREEGIGLVAYSPLARGFLCGSGRATRRTATDDRIAIWYGRDPDRDVTQMIGQVARERGVSPAAVALAWTLGRPGIVAAAVGPTDAAQLDDLHAAMALQLDDEETARIDARYAARAAAGHG